APQVIRAGLRDPDGRESVVHDSRKVGPDLVRARRHQLALVSREQGEMERRVPVGEIEPRRVARDGEDLSRLRGELVVVDVVVPARVAPEELSGSATVMLPLTGRPPPSRSDTLTARASPARPLPGSLSNLSDSGRAVVAVYAGDVAELQPWFASAARARAARS